MATQKMPEIWLLLSRIMANPAKYCEVLMNNRSGSFTIPVGYTAFQVHISQMNMESETYRSCHDEGDR